MWRKAGRRLARVGGGVLALTVVALVAGLIVLHTDWGRGLVRARVEHVLRTALPGGAKIGKIEGSVFSTLTLRDIELDSLAHRPLIKVGSLKISAVIWPLVTRTVRVESIVVEDVQVDPSAGPMVPPAPDEPKAPPSAWTIELPHIELHRAAIELGGPALSVRALDLAAAVTIAGRDITACAWLGGAWGDKQVAALATVAIDGDGMRVPGAMMMMDAGGGRARVAVHDVVVDMARPRGTVIVSAPAPVIGVWFPVAAQVAALGAPLGDAEARLSLGAGAAGATAIAVTGRAGTAHLDATLQATFVQPTVRGVLALTGLALPALTRGTLAGTGAAVVAIDAAIDHARVELAVLPALVARPAPVTIAALDRAAKALAGSGSLAAIGHELAGPSAPAAPRVFAAAELARHGATWSLVASRAAGTIAGLSVGGTPVRGAFAFRVQALAPRTPAPLPVAAPAMFVDADVEGGVELRGGGLAELAVASADGQFRGRVTGSDVQVRGELAVDGIAHAGQPIGDVRLAIAHRRGQPIDVEIAVRPAAAKIAADASLRIALGDLIRIELPRLALQMPDGKHWDGGGGVVTIGDRITLRGLALRHDAAALEVGGQFDPARGDLAAKITAAHIALDALSPRLRGNGGLVVDVARRGQRWRADARLDLTGFAAGKATPPTDASVHIALGGDKLTIDAHASSPDTGALDVQIATAAPRDPTNLLAWRRLDARAIHTLKLTAHQLQIGSLVERASEVELDDEADAPATSTGTATAAAEDAAPSDPIRGTIDGALDLAPTQPGGALAIRGVGLPFGVLDGDIALAPHDGALAIKLDARMPNIATAHVGAELGVPAHPFDPATWRDGGRSLLRAAEASIDKVRINAAMLERLGVAQKLAARGLEIPYRASVAARAHVGAGARDATLDLDLTGVRGGVLAQSLAEHLALTVDPTGTQLHGELVGGGIKRNEDGTVPLGTLDATLAMTMAQWQATPRAALSAALAARWSLAETDAIPVLAIFGRKELTGGTLAIDAEVRGTPLAPTLDHTDVTARRLAVAPRLGGHPPARFDELAISARMADGAAAVSVKGRESDGGSIDAQLGVPLGAPDVIAAATGALTAHQVDLSPIAALLPGRFSAIAGTLDGQLALGGGKVAGSLAITGGALPIAPVIGTLRDATARLTIKDQAVHVEATGGLGGGAIQLTADTPPDLASASAKVSLTKVALLGSRRTEISAEIDAKLKLDGGQVRGDLALSHTKIHVLPRAGAALLDVDAPTDLELPGTAIAATAPGAKPVPAAPVAPPASPPVRLHVALGNTTLWAPEAVQVIPGVDVATAYVTAHSEDGLDVTLGDSVNVVGRIEVDSGDVDFLGRRYMITPVSSAVAFDGSLDPLLLIQMAYAFPSMTLTADVRGRVSAPDPHLSTDVAGYSDDQLFAFFLGGSPSNDLASASDTGTRDAVASALAKVATGALGRQANRFLPVKLDSVACAPSTTAASGSCSLGKQLSHGLYLYYSTRPAALSTENTNEFQLQYRLNNTTLIDVTGGDRGNDSVDILSRHPW